MDQFKPSKRLIAPVFVAIALSACGGTAAPSSAPAPASSSAAAKASGAAPAPSSVAAKPAASSAAAKPAASGAAAKPAAGSSAKPEVGAAPLAGGSAGPAAPGQFTEGNPYLAKPGEQPVTVKAGWCAISAGFLQLYVARDYGLFEKYGINIQTGGMNSGADAALAANAKGDFDFMYCAAAATIPGLVAGHEDTLIAAPLVGLPYVMVANKNIHSVQDLNGKKIGISRPGDLDDFLSRAVLKQENIPASSVTMVPAGGQTERYKNLLAGVIDAANVTPPLDVQAQHDGLNLIYHLNKLTIPFIYSAMHTNQNMLKNHPQTVQRFLAAIAESVWYIDGHKQQAEESIKKQLGISDQAALDSAYQAYAKDFVNPSIDVPMDAVQESIDLAKTQGTPMRKDKAEQITDLRFVKDLQTSGFLEKMWGKKIPPSK